MIQAYLRKLYNHLVNAGFDDETIVRLQPQICESNSRTMKLYWILSTLILAVLSVGSVLFQFMAHYLAYYSCACVGTALSGLFWYLSSRYEKLLNAAIFLLIFTLLVFGIVLGTVVTPNQTAVAYVALILAIPMLFCLRPIYTLGILLANDILFFICCFHFKPENMLYEDMLNTIPFTIASFLVSLHITQVRLHQFVLEEELKQAQEKERQRNQELEYHCNNDAMTDMGNYFSYLRLEQEFKLLSVGSPTGVLFADLNRLKYINDHLGHLAGNDYIVSFAQRLKSAFPDCKCFRLSGDEFLIVGFNQRPDDFLERATQFRDAINGETIPVSAVGFVCEVADSLVSLQKSAELKMYEEKLAFYQRFPEFKR